MKKDSHLESTTFKEGSSSMNDDTCVSFFFVCLEKIVFELSRRTKNVSILNMFTFDAFSLTNSVRHACTVYHLSHFGLYYMNKYRGGGFRRCFVKPGRGRWGRSRKICPPLLSASLFTAHLPRVKRGAGVTRGLIRTVPIFGRTEAREKAKRGTRARRGAFRRRRVR